MNNQTTPVNSTILRNKLGKLAIRLQQQANPLGTNTDFDTLEKVVTEAVKILSQFHHQLSEPSFKPTNIIPDTLPDAMGFNNNFTVILDDLTVVFNEFENLEGVVLGEFNYMVSRLNRLNRKMKSVSSQLGDYILFSDLQTKDAVFFGDTFTSLDRVESDSPLLNATQCEVNQVEGIVTLPIDRQAQVAINVTEVPVINSNSNGVSGNNQEAGAQFHGYIPDILDNNADTWFEYERVLSADDGVPLVLDFTINMGESRVINFVRVNPNNFGTRTQVEILAIDTSIDGKEFVSIKDDIPIAGFTAEDEENIFTLAPSTSKFAGQGLYTFTPRKAKYVRLSLKQSTPYVITTSTGAQRQRYAIGIRDVDIQAVPYFDEGEVISSNYSIGDDVRKVIILSNQNPSPDTTSVLASVDHYVSPDNGITWHQLRPAVSAGTANVDQTVPELLDFNGVATDTIATESDVKSLRYKAVLKRNTDAFTDDSSELAQVIEDITELHKPPSTTPFELTLQQVPIDGTLKLIDPQFGSRGKEDVKYQIATGTGAKLNILLPFKPLKRSMQKVYTGGVWTLRDLDPQNVYIDGVEWARGQLAGSNNRYQLNFEEGRLTFGDGTNGNVVPDGSTVSMTLEEERIFPGIGEEHIASLDYPTSNDQKQMEIYLVGEATKKSVLLKKGTTRHELDTDVISGTLISGNDSVLNVSAEEAFIDGDTELTASDDWSLDYTNGTLYMYTATPTTNDFVLSYQYYPRTQLTEKEWAFKDSDDGVANAVSIFDSVFTTYTADTLTIPAGVKYFNLAHLAAVRGTVQFTNSAGNVPSELSQEVDYIDGHSELLGVVQAVEELEALNIGGAGVYEIPFKLKITEETNFAVSFSNSTVFSTDVGAGTPSSSGEYKIERGTGRTGVIKVYLTASVAEPGKVTYYYNNPQAILVGRYSIDYNSGEVFTYSSTPSSTTVDYEYTDYRVKYDIAREVVSDDWTLDTANNKVQIKDREILKGTRIPQQTGGLGSSVTKYYQLSYQYVKESRATVDELEPFFSPVIKDYALKIITKSRLI